jgi:chromosomal replication initiator protein
MERVVMQALSGFAQWIALPENLSALAAVRELSRCVQTNDLDRDANLLYLHGPPGVGKSALTAALADDLSGGSGLSVSVVSANDFPLPWSTHEADTGRERYQEACACDLLVIEDLQHLPARAGEALVQLLDERLPLRMATVVTASAGPAQIAPRGGIMPARLTNRLAAGLVVAMQPLQAASRRLFLDAVALRCSLRLPDDILSWLSASLSGCRQLVAALNEIAALERLTGKPVTLDTLRQHFQVPVELARPSVERIVRHVGDYYRVEPRQMQSARRQRRLLMPRQVSMYLARRLTALSLQQIGAYFGGRDHSTVLHACRKVEEAIESDGQLAGAVRQIHGELA